MRAAFDRFGLMSIRGGKHVTVYFDDMADTARRPPGHRPIRHEQKIVVVPHPKGRGSIVRSRDILGPRRGRDRAEDGPQPPSHQDFWRRPREHTPQRTQPTRGKSWSPASGRSAERVVGPHLTPGLIGR